MSGVSLPRPDPCYGFYALADGSRIYPSGSAECPIHPGKFFAWVRRGSVKKPDGKYEPAGEILLTRDGIRYFDSPQDAAKAIRAALQGKQE